jgi:hypothetical protein
MTALIVSTGLGYLFGNIQTSYLLGKWTRKIDIRDHGTAAVFILLPFIFYHFDPTLIRLGLITAISTLLLI